MFDALTVREHIEYVRMAYDSEITDEEIEKILKAFEMDDKQDKLGNELSKGMMQKVSICCALAVKPEVILLDEPMVGLDPAAIKMLKDVVLKLRDNGATVLISTHMLEMVENLWDVMIVMEQGHIAGSYTKADAQGKELILTAPHPSPLSAYRGFFGSRPFSKTNEFLESQGEEPIDWQIE